jgi:eukaryotic-like serine/threonine-protein kinase
MILAPGTKLGPYEILAPIGAGGMGEVYRARDPRVGRDVAIKVSSEQFKDRFTREIHAVAALNHSNVCTLYDVGPNYLVMELIEGPTLADRIKQGAIPPEESLAIARQITDALEAAHEKGIVHRDLKPGNIKLRPDGTVKVLDFGLAKVEETAAVSLETSPTLSVAQTAVGVLLGTAAYMSPEQARGKPVDKRADIWAFGVVLYEMLTGRQLFTGETVSDTLAATLKEEPDFEKVPAKVRPLLRSCLEKNPARRLRDIGDAWRLLENVPESPKGIRVNRWLAWSIAALILIVAAATVSSLHFRSKPSTAELTRLEMNLPENVTFGPVGFINLSPDGRKFVFIGTGPDGVTRLWLRTLDSLETRPLFGTESNIGLSFFWSPDSRFVAFETADKLKKIDISGGPPQSICNLPALVTGGSWNHDGVILFADYQGSNEIMRVAAGGGTASPVTRLDPLRKEENHILPLFLPNGRHFLYFCNSSIAENQGIFVGSVDAKPEEQGRKQVVRTSWSGSAYVPSQISGPGQLLFMREQALVAQPFDDKRLQLVGEPLPIAEHIGYFINSGLFSASTNGVLIYKGGGPLHQLSQPAWFDRQGKQLGFIGERGSYYGLALSSDGSRAIMSWMNLTQGRAPVDLWLHDFAQGTHRQFTFGEGENISPIFSPDGSRIIFASNRDGGMHNLYQKPVSGTRREEQLAISKEDKYPTSWSADGRFVLFTARDARRKYQLWALPLEDDRKPVPFPRTEFNEFDGQFSPDGRWVAYVSDEYGSNEIYVRDFSPANGAVSSKLGSKWRISNEGGTAPRWAKDGGVLYFRSIDGKVMAVDVAPGAAFSAGTPRSVFQATPVFQMGGESFIFLQWNVASDGKRFLLVAPAAESSPTSLNVILNWTALLKK